MASHWVVDSLTSSKITDAWDLEVLVESLDTAGDPILGDSGIMVGEVDGRRPLVLGGSCIHHEG